MTTCSAPAGTHSRTIRATSATVRPERIVDQLLTMLTPISWGTTYVVTATLLPPDRPLLAAVLRALPAGLLILLLVRRMPPSPTWWWRFTVLGVLNFGAFFPLLFFAAYRLPGGVAATVSTVQPLLVAGFAWLLLRTRTPVGQLLAALVGVLGVALMTIGAKVHLDPLALVAMVVATGMLGFGIVLAKRWGSPGSPLMSAGWQMTLGGLLLAPFTLAFEGLPDTLTGSNLLGYLYLATIGGAISYWLWFRGIERLTPTTVSLLGLANPLTATLAGLVILGEFLTAGQTVGLAVALLALVAGQTIGRQSSGEPQRQDSGAVPAAGGDVHRHRVRD